MKTVRGDRLHPQRLAEYIGQERIKETLRAAIDDALSHDEPLDHVLLYGPPGLGKTTLATIIAAEMGANLLMTTGHEIERPGDMASMLTSLKPGDVLFIDEIHRLNKRVNDILYPGMENYTLSWTYGKGLELRSVKIALEPFTLVGAMPRYHRLGPPPRDQFGITYPLDFYDKEAIQAIVRRTAGILSLEIDAGGIYEIARRARGISSNGQPPVALGTRFCADTRGWPHHARCCIAGARADEGGRARPRRSRSPSAARAHRGIQGQACQDR